MLSDWGISLPSRTAGSHGVLMLIPEPSREMSSVSALCHLLAAAVAMKNKPAGIARSSVAKIKAHNSTSLNVKSYKHMECVKITAAALRKLRQISTKSFG